MVSGFFASGQHNEAFTLRVPRENSIRDIVSYHITSLHYTLLALTKHFLALRIK